MNILKYYLCEFELLLKKKQQIAPLNGTICYSDNPIHSLQILQSYNERCKVQKQKMRCKNRPRDLLIHLHIVRQNSACVCKAVQATRHTLFRQLNHNKVLNKKYNIYFSKTNTTYYWETSSACVLVTFTKWHHRLHNMYQGFLV